jgi:hypothetical protein
LCREKVTEAFEVDIVAVEGAGSDVAPLFM